MSLILNNTSLIHMNIAGDSSVEDQRALAQLDRYLAVVEDNKKSSHFVPSDALLALDMAGFVRGRLRGGYARPQVSAARMALSLVQKNPQMPLQ